MIKTVHYGQGSGEERVIEFDEVRELLKDAPTETVESFILQVAVWADMQKNTQVMSILEKYRRIDPAVEQLRDTAAVKDVQKAIKTLVSALNAMRPEDRSVIGLSNDKAAALGMMLEDMGTGIERVLPFQKPGRGSGADKGKMLAFETLARTWQQHFPQWAISPNTVSRSLVFMEMVFGDDAVALAKAYKRKQAKHHR